MRNPDEFYHKMHKARMQDGTHKVMVKDKAGSKKMLKMEEDHDIALVNLKRQVESKKADKLQANLHMMDL